MTVTLSKRTEEMVNEQMKTGRFASPDEAVNTLLEERLSEEQGSPLDLSESELKASLLAAVNKPTRPYRKGEFVELAHRVIAEARGA